jgi:hypothetical protein
MLEDQIHDKYMLHISPADLQHDEEEMRDFEIMLI